MPPPISDSGIARHSSDMPSPDFSRRHFLELLLLTTACVPSPEPVLTAEPEPDDSLHARPKTPQPENAPVITEAPQPLGLGNDRDGYFYAPAAVRKNAPLLLYLHGASGSGQRGIKRWLTDAERHGIIVVAPDSRDRTWGVSLGDESDDLAFIDRALNKIFASYSVDVDKIAITGFSDGASAALSWGLLNGDLFNVVLAFSPGFVHLAGRPKGMPRVYISHGLNDEILPIDRCGRRIANSLHAAGYDLKFQIFDGGHDVPDEIRGNAVRWFLGKG